MRTRPPKEFIDAYRGKEDKLYAALEDIKSTLSLRIGQMNARKGTRCKFADARVKRPIKLWIKSRERGVSIEDTFKNIEDLLGVRIVCNNLSDMSLIIDMVNNECHNLTISEVKDQVVSPDASGYRAIHIRVLYGDFSTPEDDKYPCEIQVRTLAQDAWARLSRVDIYGRSVPSQITRLTKALATQLSAIDDIAQLIRDELTKTPAAADEMQDTDAINPQRLALLYKDKYGEDLFEWSLLNWVRNLEEAEVSTIGEVKKLIDDNKMRVKLNEIAQEIRKFDLEDGEWVVLRAMIAAEFNAPRGIEIARQKLKSDWDEITIQARSSTLPITFDDFVQDLRAGDSSLDMYFDLLDCFDACDRCSADTFKGTSFAAEQVLDYYQHLEGQDELFYLIDDWRLSQGYSDGGSVCDYCDYTWSKIKDD